MADLVTPLMTTLIGMNAVYEPFGEMGAEVALPLGLTFILGDTVGVAPGDPRSKGTVLAHPLMPRRDTLRGGPIRGLGSGYVLTWGDADAPWPLPTWTAVLFN